MRSRLEVSLGQHSERGRKETNQDFHGACLPGEPLRTAKGLAFAVADGVSSSAVSRVASEAAVKGFLEDYFCTSPAWSVKTSAQRVLAAVNGWLHAQTRQSQYRYDAERGYVCTLTALVLKSTTAHLFHVGDARVYRLREGALEQLTEDHRLWISQEQSYLSRALGAHAQLEIDYQALRLEPGDIFLLATDGVHELIGREVIVSALQAHASDLDAAARLIVRTALERGSADNLTAQIVRIDSLPEHGAEEIPQQAAELPCPPPLSPRMRFEGYTLVRELHASSRSHVYLALDEEAATPVVLKMPSIDRQGDPGYLERFLLEDWIARRIDHVHVVKAYASRRRPRFLYTVTEHIEGQTLAQWMIDHPRPALETVRGVIEQIAKGLLAFHRLEMLHQDLRPANIMIDRTGTVKIVDFGSVRVAGLEDCARLEDRSVGAGGESSAGAHELLGTAQYTAPEYFLGEPGTPRSDLFSLGVIAYQMLSGRLPYGAEVAKARTRAAQQLLQYRSVLARDRDIPAWVDEVLRKATHPNPLKRYAELSEFTHDLRYPSAGFLRRAQPPLIERHPLAFWQILCGVLLLAIAALLLFN